MIRQNAQVSDPMWENIATQTKDDEELKDVLNAMHFGWESDHAQSLKPYYHFRGDITEIDGVLVKGPKVIIPKTLQGDMLKKIHEGHLGIEKCQARARQVMYWPNINKRHLLKTEERFVPVHDDDDGEKEVCVDHPSGGATASTNQSAVTPEAAQSSHSTDQSQPVSTISYVRTTRSGRIIKLPSRYVHD